MAWSDILDKVVGTGTAALGNLANREIFGDDEAVRIAMAQERDYYAGVNGSGPNDRSGALRDANYGSVYGKPDQFSGVNPLGGMNGWQIMAIVGLVAALAVVIFRRR